MKISTFPKRIFRSAPRSFTITGWVKSRYRGDALEFIEDVPYEETRNYIKLVMRNFIFYKRLNSGGAPVEFPEWCLANLQDIKP